MSQISRVLQEQPFRLATWAWLRAFSRNVETRANWGISARPEYLFGLYHAALQAKLEGAPAFSALEFGVATGRGLLALQNEAIAVEAALGIKIEVYGFDSGGGLPTLIGDHRDHPDEWRPGDFPMDVPALRAKLDVRRTKLILGDVAETVPSFTQEAKHAPIGFVSFDLDLYSSTRDAMKIFADDLRKSLFRVMLYFDDIVSIFNNIWSGELLAIEEFNENSTKFKIDKWHGIKHDKPFPERKYWDKFFVAHDLDTIGQFSIDRNAATKPVL